MSQYLESTLFDTIPVSTYKISITKQDITHEIVFDTCKFILDAPIGSGKSTALMNHIKDSKDNNYIIIVPTTNIAVDFYNAVDYSEDSVKLCTNDGAFKDIKLAFDNNVRVIITTYHTASRCLGSIIEFTHGNLLNKYHLFIDEAHLLLLHPALIEMTREFNYVGLITATPRELKHLSVFKDYVTISPVISTHYHRKLYINKLTNLSLQYHEIIELVKTNINDFNAIIIKIEDKHEGRSLKELLVKENIGALLYNGDNKETELINGRFVDKSNGDPIMNKVVVCTSTIQAGQSINDNVLQIFIQTPLDNYSSVEQFIGRNRSSNSITYLFLNIDGVVNKSISNNLADRYYNRLHDTRVKAWRNTNIDKWMRILNKHGEIILSDTLLNKISNPDDNENKPIEFNNELYNENMYNGKDLNIRFKGKKELYSYYGTKIFPHPYKIIMSKNTCDDGKRARMYRLIYNENVSMIPDSTDLNTKAMESNDKSSTDKADNAISEFNGRSLNVEFRGKKELYSYYGTKIFPNTLKIKEMRPTIDGKRVRKYMLVSI